MEKEIEEEEREGGKSRKIPLTSAEMKEAKKYMPLSRALTKILRHTATKLGLEVKPNGYVRIKDLVKVPPIAKFKPKMEDIEKVVKYDNKQRLQISQNKEFIRAVQGHTMKEVTEEELMEPITDPTKYPTVVHGTYATNWKNIYKTGLSKMSHFAPGYPKEGQVVSGIRSSCDTFIEIDMAKAMKDGVPFFISQNNVILTPGIEGILPRKYFKRVLIHKEVVYQMEKAITHLLEIAVAVVDVANKTVLKEFDCDVQKLEESKEKPKLADALLKLDAFLNENKVPLDEAVVVTRTELDLKEGLAQEASDKKLPLPPYLRQFINLRHVFPAQEFIFGKEEEKMHDLPTIMKLLKVVPEGTFDTALGTAHNLAKVVIKLLEQNVEFSRDFVEGIHQQPYSV